MAVLVFRMVWRLYFKISQNSDARIVQSKIGLIRAFDLHRYMLLFHAGLGRFGVCSGLHLHATMLVLPAKIGGQMAILIRWRFGPHCHTNV